MSKLNGTGENLNCGISDTYINFGKTGIHNLQDF